MQHAACKRAACSAPRLNRPVSRSVEQSASTSCMATGRPGAVRSSARKSSGAGHPEPSGRPFRVTRRVCHSCAPRRLCVCTKCREADTAMHKQIVLAAATHPVYCWQMACQPALWLASVAQSLPRRAKGCGFCPLQYDLSLGAHRFDQQPQAVLAELHKDHVWPHGRDELGNAVAGRARHVRRAEYVDRCTAAWSLACWNLPHQISARCLRGCSGA